MQAKYSFSWFFCCLQNIFYLNQQIKIYLIVKLFFYIILLPNQIFFPQQNWFDFFVCFLMISLIVPWNEFLPQPSVHQKGITLILKGTYYLSRTISQTAQHAWAMWSVVTTACVNRSTQSTVLQYLAVAYMNWSTVVYMEPSEKRRTTVQQTIGTKPAASTPHLLVLFW